MLAGTCDVEQVTREGLGDAVRHGQDFWGVYHSKRAFLEHVTQETYVLALKEPPMHHVTGAMRCGVDWDMAKKY
ncbi:hypothetical protein ID866_4932 [Astraeus odoratus]|nr:hypothetical protein ID866_4932 [Astraeus odoratus]